MDELNAHIKWMEAFHCAQIQDEKVKSNSFLTDIVGIFRPTTYDQVKEGVRSDEKTT